MDSVSASSSFNEELGPENLIDGDPATYWNDASQHGDNAELVFEFFGPVAIDHVVLQNVLEEAPFKRNFRIRGYEITTDDLDAPVIGELSDSNEPQTVEVDSQETTRLVIRVTSTYPAESVDGQVPFEELALAEVVVMGSSG